MKLTVEVLMATRNGAAHLPGQLASIAWQRGVYWRLVAGDDGSADATCAILRDFARRTGRAEVRAAAGRGAAGNFLALLAAPGGPGYTALSDQDDVWFPDRLARAAAALGPWDAAEPRVYASRTVLVDGRGARLAVSPPLRRAPGFANALVQNVLAGNTIVMNAAARELARQAQSAAGGVPFHDWWLYALLTGAGARVIHDDRPGLYYRQHGSNLMGAHRGLAASAARLRRVLGRDYGDWLRRNAEALEGAETVLTRGFRDTLARFREALELGGLRQARALAGTGVRRQTWPGTLCVLGAAALRRL